MFRYNINRLPRQLTYKIIQKNISWMKEWNFLGEEFGLNWTSNNILYWEQNINTFLQALTDKQHQVHLENARNSVERVYKYLDYSKDQTYIYSAFSKHKIMWIFKARTGSIFLNAARHGEESQKLCSLCNLREKEDIEHFIGKCPILREQRIVYFGKSILDHSEVINALNGIEDENWNKLYNYICQAIEYRKYLINEFNV